MNDDSENVAAADSDQHGIFGRRAGRRDVDGLFDGLAGERELSDKSDD